MKIICVGRNYTEHIKELNNETPTEPVVFMKPDTALLRGEDFYIPEYSQNVQYEVEVVLKISKPGKYIQAKNAHKHYETIGLGIDFTARDIQQELKSKGLPWELSKAFDGSAVASPFFTKEMFDLDDLQFSLHKNKTVVQDGNTKQMIHHPHEIIAFVSQFFLLKKGDLIYTGTPAGVGPVAIDDYLEGYLNGEKVFQLFIK